jgi:hypothetical protein
MGSGLRTGDANVSSEAPYAQFNAGAARLDDLREWGAACRRLFIIVQERRCCRSIRAHPARQPIRPGATIARSRHIFSRNERYADRSSE